MHAMVVTGGFGGTTDTCCNLSVCREDEEGFIGMSSHATLEVLPSRDIKVRACCMFEGPAGPMPECVFSSLPLAPHNVFQGTSSISFLVGFRSGIAAGHAVHIFHVQGASAAVVCCLSEKALPHAVGVWPCLGVAADQRASGSCSTG